MGEPCMSRRLEGKVALVTRCRLDKPGISNGRASALRFAEQGAAVCVLGPIDRRTPARPASSSPRRAESPSLSKPMSRPKSRWFGRSANAYRGLERSTSAQQCRRFSAGGGADTKVGDSDLLTHVNLKAVFLPTKHVLPHFVERKRGVVINMSSIAAFRYLGAPTIAYATTKGAMSPIHAILPWSMAGTASGRTLDSCPA